MDLFDKFHPAELLVYGSQRMSTGCTGDVEKASRLALELVKEHCFCRDHFFRSEHPSSHSPGFRRSLAEAKSRRNLIGPLTRHPCQGARLHQLRR